MNYPKKLFTKRILIALCKIIIFEEEDFGSHGLVLASFEAIKYYLLNIVNGPENFEEVCIISRICFNNLLQNTQPEIRKLGTELITNIPFDQVFHVEQISESNQIYNLETSVLLDTVKNMHLEKHVSMLKNIEPVFKLFMSQVISNIVPDPKHSESIFWNYHRKENENELVESLADRSIKFRTATGYEGIGNGRETDINGRNTHYAAAYQNNDPDHDFNANGRTENSFLYQKNYQKINEQEMLLKYESSISKNESWINWKILWDCSRYIVINKLKTPFGSAKETLLKIEKAIKQYDYEITEDKKVTLDDSLINREGFRDEDGDSSEDNYDGFYCLRLGFFLFLHNFSSSTMTVSCKHIIYVCLIYSNIISGSSITKLGFFKGPYSNQKVCNNEKYLPESSEEWYLTSNILYTKHMFNYYLSAPKFFSSVDNAHKYCDTLGARVWCPENPEELEAVELSFRETFNFSDWRNNRDFGISTGFVYLPESADTAFCYSLPFDKSQKIENKVIENVWNANGGNLDIFDRTHGKKSLWDKGGMDGTNKSPNVPTTIFLGQHNKVRGEERWYLSSFRSAALADPTERPFLCQIICPDSHTSYGDFNLNQDSLASRVENTEQDKPAYLEITRKFPESANVLLEHRFGNNSAHFLNKILNHGCWCHKLKDDHSDYVGGKTYLDDLDYICKIWFYNKRCTQITSGSCQYEPIAKKNSTETYKFPIDTLNFHCNDLNLNKCALDLCLVDNFYSGKVLDFLAEHPNFESENGSHEICEKIPSRYKGKKKYCTGRAPDLYIASFD